MAEFVNAAPMVNDRGTKDMSTRNVPETPLEIPQHLPLLYIFAEKGPVGRYYLDHDNASLTQIYGDATFDLNKDYFSHQTPFLSAAASAGNNVVVHRLVAPDAKDVANVALYLDVLETEVPLYKKNSDGSVELDEDGNPVPSLDVDDAPITVSGFKVAWVTETTVATVGEYERGFLTERNGVQTDGVNQSKQYPIYEFAARDQGEAGNRISVKMHAAMRADLVPFPDHILTEGKVYPYYFAMAELMDPITGVTNHILNSFGSQFATFSSKVRSTDPGSGAVIDLPSITNNMYINVPPSLASGLGAAFVYDNNLEEVLGKFYDAEKNLEDAHRDGVINNEENNLHALNIASFTSSNGSPYQSIKLVDIAGSTRLTKNTNLFLQGSSDGTINTALLDTLVAADLENYNGTLHEYNDLVMHPESIIYDSGFSIDTKKAFPKFISRRKDTFVVLASYAHNAPSISLDQQYSVALALKSMLELYPESATFGTPVMRGMVVGGSGRLVNSLYQGRVPLTYELMYKAARYMGAKDGAWKSGFAFDRAPRSVVTELRDIDVTWVPASTRNTLWSVGLNFVLNYKVRSQFFPALQTVYENDTSVLNSFFTAVAISYLNKIAHAAWREFTGSMSLTNAQLEERVNTFVDDSVRDKFDGKFIIRPDATVTELDDLRGFSWTLPIRIYANGMKTVMSTEVQAFRMSDLD